MGQDSKIEWTDASWNPVTGCDECSPGCKNCYAKPLAIRLQAMGQPNYANGFEVTLQPHMLDKPLQWKRPRMIFVNSMSDLFHKDVPEDYIQRVFDVMRRADWHTFQILTKRASRLADIGQRIDWPKNVWMGVSVENQAMADKRIPELLKVPAAVRFLSCEPLLGPVDLLHVDAAGFGGPPGHKIDCIRKGFWSRNLGFVNHSDMHDTFGALHWVIAGGESGPNARPMHPDWARSLRDQCQAANIPFHFKQWGEYAPSEVVDAQHPDDPWYCDRNFYKPRSYGRDDPARVRFFDGKGRLVADPSDGCTDTGKVTMLRVGKKSAGRLLDGKTWDEYPSTINHHTKTGDSEP